MAGHSLRARAATSSYVNLDALVSLWRNERSLVRSMSMINPHAGSGQQMRESVLIQSLG